MGSRYIKGICKLKILCEILRVGFFLGGGGNCKNVENMTIKSRSDALWTKKFLTRKSSCVNARGIPTAAYQVLLGGIPPPPSVGVPPPTARFARGYPRWSTPHWGTPPGQVWWGVPKVGYPQPGLMWGVSEVGNTPCWGTPRPGLMGVPEVGYPPSGYPPWPGLTGGGYPRWGTDGWMDGWMDRHVWKHYLPVVLCTRSVIMVKQLIIHQHSCELSTYITIKFTYISLLFLPRKPYFPGSKTQVNEGWHDELQNCAKQKLFFHKIQWSSLYLSTE